MNITTNGKKHQGSVLLVALLTAWVIGIALVSYLTLVASQNRSTYHSQTWNACIPVLEAGVEEALNQIHYVGITANFASNQWTNNPADGKFYKTRTLTNSEGSYYVVSILPIDPRGGRYGPVIESSGYVVAPGTTGTALGGQSAFGMILGTVSGSLSPSTPRFVSRKVRVTTVWNGPLAIKSKGPVSVTGGSFLDSFDSSPGSPYNTLGRYDPAKHKAKAIVLTNSSDPLAINIGGTIYGSVTTGPDGGVVANNGSVGDLGFAGTQPGVQSGHQSDDANVQFDDVAPPFEFGTELGPQNPGLSSVLTGVLTSYTWVLDSGNYQMLSANINSSRTMLVTGNATLYVLGNFSTTGSGASLILAPGASLKLYIGGTASFSGSGIVNQSGRAKNLSIYGLNSSTSFSYTGSSSFIGTVNAPYASIKFTGNTEVIGAFTGKDVTFNGGAHVGYDEDLSGEAVVESWNEI